MLTTWTFPLALLVLAVTTAFDLLSLLFEPSVKNSVRVNLPVTFVVRVGVRTGGSISRPIRSKLFVPDEVICAQHGCAAMATFSKSKIILFTGRQRLFVII